MQHVCSKLIIALLFFFSTNLLAFPVVPNVKTGVWITPNLPATSNWPLRTGDSFVFDGDICIVQWNFLDKREKCQKIKDNHIEIKAFYPNELTEVTSDLVINKSNNQKDWKYSYRANQVSSGQDNTFTLVVGSTRHEVEKLLHIKAKLNKRIHLLNQLKLRFLRKKNHKDYIEYLIGKIEKIILSIDNAVDADPSVLAKLTIPLQVENDIAKNMSYSSNFSGHKLALSIPLGSPIDGESTEITASITNLSHYSFYFPQIYNPLSFFDSDLDDDGLFLYRANLYHDGEKILDIDNVNLGFGQTYSKTIPLSELSAYSPNKFIFEFEKSFKYKFSFLRKYHKWGVLKLDLPVSEDHVLPEVSDTLPGINYRYAKTMAPYSLTIKDSFGRLDKESFELKANANLIDGTHSSVDFTNIMTVTDKDLRREYLIESDLNPLNEGEWTFLFKGKDFAGNSVEYTQVTRIDRTAPIVAILNEDNTLTNNPTYNLIVTTEDHSPVTVNILQNGEAVYTTSDPLINFETTLIEGINTFEVQVVDAAGNIASPVKLNNVELDTIPPQIAVTPTDNSTIFSLSFPFKGTSNENLSLVVLNGENQSVEGSSF